MADYKYRCPSCLKEKEVNHPMSECDNPSEETVLKTTCNSNTCESIENAQLGLDWLRVPQNTSMLKYGHGTYDKGGLKSIKEKQSVFAKRSEADNKKQGVDEQKREKSKEIVEKFK